MISPLSNGSQKEGDKETAQLRGDVDSLVGQLILNFPPKFGKRRLVYNFFPLLTCVLPILTMDLSISMFCSSSSTAPLISDGAGGVLLFRFVEDAPSSSESKWNFRQNSPKPRLSGKPVLCRRTASRIWEPRSWKQLMAKH